MLTTNECLNLDDYVFKSSPESCSSNSCSTDYNDFPSDEDFLQQLSSDLDIPLLLNPGEDELCLLNSFFDKSPEEIMSEIALPTLPNEKFEASMNEIKLEPDSCSSSNKSNSPVQSPEPVKFFEIKDEMKVEPPEIETKAPVQFTPKATKRVPIQPKTSKNKLMLFKNPDFNANLSPPPPKVVVLENVATITPSVTNSCTMPPVILKSNNLPINVGNIDPKILKRQQRKIKNRESACLSRKKKKDYLTALENQVKELTAENHKLKTQNMQLAERLTKYEGNNGQKTNNIKTSIVLCMFLFSVAFNFDYLRNPFTSRNPANMLETNTQKVVDHHGRNLLWATDDLMENNNTNSNFLPFSMCPAAINQTESARLVLELERWIGKPKNSKDDPPVANATKQNISALKLRSMRKRKQKKYASPLVPSVYSLSQKLEPVENNNELQVFSPSPEQIYTEFFEAINRQSDTFYVVSFSDHHMLLPALHHNKTRRPKMSLIMPSMLSNGNISQSLVPLMQIDCEVLDTRLIQVRYGSIPVHLRKDGNGTVQNSEQVSKNNDAAANYTHKKAYEPYFIKRKSVSTKEEEDFYNIR